MTLEFILTENDFLQLQLYIASKDKGVKRRKMISWICWPFIFVAIAYLSNNKQIDTFLLYYFLSIAAVWLIAFPFYYKWRYKKFYGNAVAKNYKARFNEPVKIIFGTDNIQTYSIAGDTRYNLSALSNIIETGNYFYAGIKTGGYLIIPKPELKNQDAVRDKLKELSDKQDISFVSDLNWKW
jgi:hypothetical protein